MKNAFEKAVHAFQAATTDEAFGAAVEEHGYALLEEFGHLLPRVAHHISELRDVVRSYVAKDPLNDTLKARALRLLGSEAPAPRAVPNGEVEALRAALREARLELDENCCLDCGADWPYCDCPNGQWWRDAGKLLGETNE